MVNLIMVNLTIFCRFGLYILSIVTSKSITLMEDFHKKKMKHKKPQIFLSAVSMIISVV
jgi:hypothetical protein